MNESQAALTCQFINNPIAALQPEDNLLNPFWTSLIADSIKAQQLNKSSCIKTVQSSVLETFLDMGGNEFAPKQ